MEIYSAVNHDEDINVLGYVEINLMYFIFPKYTRYSFSFLVENRLVSNLNRIRLTKPGIWISVVTINIVYV